MCITIQPYSFQVALYEYNLLSDLFYRIKMMMMMMMICNVETFFCESKLTDFMIHYLTWCTWLRSAKERNPLMAKLPEVTSKTSPKTSHTDFWPQIIKSIPKDWGYFTGDVIYFFVNQRWQVITVPLVLVHEQSSSPLIGNDNVHPVSRKSSVIES